MTYDEKNYFEAQEAMEVAIMRILRAQGWEVSPTHCSPAAREALKVAYPRIEKIIREKIMREIPSALALYHSKDGETK